MMLHTGYVEISKRNKKGDNSGANIAMYSPYIVQ